jgi:hypothetical protein
VVLLHDVGEVEAVWVCLEKVLISAQDRCTVCVECTTCMEIFLGAPNGLGVMGQVDARFGPFRGRVNVSAR